jgi:hypothetical protein
MEKNLKERWKAKTPKFWKKVQSIALITGTIAAIIISAPVSLPAGIITTATYLVSISATIATTAQLTVDDAKAEEELIN